jgi:DNA repair exonuclease SbcCD nuclease subunit
MTNFPLKKSASFTDIHFGKKSNSPVHNQDCINFVEWFCEQVRKDPEIDHIVFMGDWHENRSALNLDTMKYSYRAANMLDELGLPIYFIVGNHDLYHRHTREVHSLITFEQFENFRVIDKPTIIAEQEIEGGAFISPYLFHDEYPDMRQHLDSVATWYGHFEFKGFVVTGYNVKMPTGPDSNEFKGPNIFSGHFHKRQLEGNICYMGNTFPMDFGDAGDFKRGMMVYEYKGEQIEFIDWEECPKYIKCTLSRLMDGKVELHENSRVKCIVDTSIDFEESTAIRQKYLDEYKLREFTLEETSELTELIAGEIVDIKDEELEDVNSLVIHMLTGIDTDKINNNKLVDIYKGLVE